MRYRHTERKGFLIGFIDFFTAGIFLIFYMRAGLQDELDEILGKKTQRYWVAYLLGIPDFFLYTLIWMARVAEDLKGKAQTVEIVNPRNEAIYLLRTLTDLSTVEIGKIFNRSHTTILHSVSKVEGMIKNYAAYEEEISELIADIKG